jgi:hypothetical protein
MPILGFAQFRNQESNTHPIEQYLRTPQNGLGFPTNIGSLLDASRMQWHYGYSMAYASSNQGSVMQGAFTTDMIYNLSRPITLMFRLGYLHEPYNTYLPEGMAPQGQFFGGAGITYQPTKNMVFQFEFQHIPASTIAYQSPFYRSAQPWGYNQ